jgi:hypothetical protein
MKKYLCIQFVLMQMKINFTQSIVSVKYTVFHFIECFI